MLSCAPQFEASGVRKGKFFVPFCSFVALKRSI
jgi:hypothetical protein